MPGFMVEPSKTASDDLSNIISMVLQSPIRANTGMKKADGVTSMEELSQANTDVQTRIITQMAYNACRGDVKAAEFILKYGGYEPPAKQEISLDVPQIIDDMSSRVLPVQNVQQALEAPSQE